jgi:hypothetical protein
LHDRVEQHDKIPLAGGVGFILLDLAFHDRHGLPSLKWQKLFVSFLTSELLSLN